MRKQAVNLGRRLATMMLAAALSPLSWAQPGVQVDGAWSRATVPGQSVGAVYLQIRSAADAGVVGVASPASKTAQIHSMATEGGVMRMRQLKELKLPAGQTVKLEPSGTHIMLLDLRRPLKAGDHVKLTLIVEQKGKRIVVPVTAEVRAVTE